MIYLDSCALVKLVVAEAETEALRARLADHDTELVTSELALTEVIRVVRRSCYDAQRRLRVEEDVLQRRLTTAGDLWVECIATVQATGPFTSSRLTATTVTDIVH